MRRRKLSASARRDGTGVRYTAALSSAAVTRRREPVLILGIDPGSRHTGWGVLRWQGDEQRLVADGLLAPGAQLGLGERLAELQRELGGLVERYRPDAAAVETPYYGMNPRSLIVLAQARGAILAALASHRLAILEYSPAEVKTAVAGNGRADKREVARMVRLLLRLGDPPAGEDGRPGDGRSADTTDAIAIALCCARRYKLDQLRRGQGAGGG
jgi:crossover junction endodeoxyribonuclease RuvC